MLIANLKISVYSCIPVQFVQFEFLKNRCKNSLFSRQIGMLPNYSRIINTCIWRVQDVGSNGEGMRCRVQVERVLRLVCIPHFFFAYVRVSFSEGGTGGDIVWKWNHVIFFSHFLLNSIILEKIWLSSTVALRLCIFWLPLVERKRWSNIIVFIISSSEKNVSILFTSTTMITIKHSQLKIISSHILWFYFVILSLFISNSDKFQDLVLDYCSSVLLVN